jgi:hypothetical protein
VAPAIDGEVLQRVLGEDSGAVDQDLHGREALGQMGEQRCGVIQPAQVGLAQMHLNAQGAGFGGRGLSPVCCAIIMEDEMASCTGQGQSQAAPDAMRAPRDQSCFPLEIHGACVR